jgi:hypothetical protein
MATFRVFVIREGPGAVSIVATLRFGGPVVADEECPREREVILRYPSGPPRTTLERLVARLDRYHPEWRQLVILSELEGG